MFLMDRVTQKLYELGIIKEFDEIRRLRLAALLHDVGHFPFSHCLERPIKNHSNKKEGSHEKLSEHIINKTSIRDMLDTYKPNDISSIISRKYVKEPIYSLLISSDLDVDRMDYLMRDAHETGVSYGFIDVDRLIRTLVVEKDHLAIEDKGRQALENFLLARYHMYQVIYYHKTVVGFELMLERIYQKLMERNMVYDFDQICKFTEEELFDFNDSYVWSLLKEHKKDRKPLGELITRFRKRKRLTRVKDIQGISMSGNEKPNYSKLSMIENPHQLRGLMRESRIPPDWIFYTTPRPLSILSNADDETAVWIVKEDKSSIPIAQDTESVISNLYDSCFLSARVYTKEEYEEQLLKGIKVCFDV
jgi:HD superfamily phosphohydrolase